MLHGRRHFSKSPATSVQDWRLRNKCFEELPFKLTTRGRLQFMGKGPDLLRQRLQGKIRPVLLHHPQVATIRICRWCENCLWHLGLHLNGAEDDSQETTAHDVGFPSRENVACIPQTIERARSSLFWHNATKAISSRSSWLTTLPLHIAPP